MLALILAYLFARPVLSHAVEAAGETLYWLVLWHLVGALLGWPPVVPEVISSLIVAAIYYGREAGQREHDLKNLGVDAIRAWLGARLFFGWSSDNALQFLSPAAATCAVCALSASWPTLLPQIRSFF